ncbi:MAG: C25 family cysteine peptidase [Candidatus Zixiibacteriota bacterium]
MKKVILFSLLLALGVFSFVWAYQINSGAADELQVKLLSADASKVRVEIKIPDLQVEDKTVEGKTYQQIIIPGGGWLTRVGDPQVPLVCRFVALPPASGVRIDVVEQEKETLSGTYLLYPYQPAPLRRDDYIPGPFQLNQQTYAQNQAFPGNLVEKGDISILRDLRLAPIKFFPVQYNPQTGEVSVYKRMVVDIYFEGTGENPQVNPRNLLTRSHLKVYENFVMNFDQIKGNRDVVDGSILIITYDDFRSAIQPLADWKQKMGYETFLVNKSTIGTTNTQIQSYISNAYHTWANPPEYVILVGDEAQIPTFSGLAGCITDHKYATVDGTDYFADLAVARISVQTSAECSHIVSKTLNYRKTPYIGQTGWFRRGMTISGSDYVDDYNALRCGRFMVDFGGFTYFDSLWASRGTNTVTQITNRLNDGRTWIAYFGHGSATTWASTSPSFTNSHIDALNNGERLPAIFSVACNNAEFNYSGGDCFAEKWMKVGAVGNEKGAVIICASTEGSAFFYSDTLGRGFYKAYFADSLYHFTPAVNSGKMFMYQYFPQGAGGTTEREMQMYTTFGDPEMDPWTAVPESLVVSHPNVAFIGGFAFTVTVTKGGQPAADAMVCLMKGTEVYQSARTGSNGQVTLYPAPVTPGSMDLTVTAHNGYPYETTVQVISPSGPYLLYQGLTVDDDNLGGSHGDNDGLVDFGETIEMSFGLRNLGDSTSHNTYGILSTTDPLVSITVDSAFWGEILAQDTALCLNPFIFTVSGQIPDQTAIPFHLDIHATNGDWDFSDITLVAHAPLLVYNSKQTDDIGGNGNNKPDPGETCNLNVTLRNDGSAGAAGISGTLSCSDPYVAVTVSSASYQDIPSGGTGSTLTPYRFTVTSSCPMGYRANMILNITGEGGYSAVDTFDVLIGQTPILFVDDDGGGSYQNYFLSALDSTGLMYDVWTYTTLGSPADSVLEQYTAVIWNTGPDYGTISNPKTLTATDQSRLMTYLNNGGNLFLSSQDVLLDNNPNTFITDYLHVVGHTDDVGETAVAGVGGDTISDGMGFSLTPPFYNFSDYIVPGSGAAGIFTASVKGSTVPREGVQLDSYTQAGKGLVDYGALRYPESGTSTYKVVFLAFPFEGVPQSGAEPDNSYTLMRRIIGWFGLGRTTPQFMHGDANGDLTIDIADVVWIINYLYKGGNPPIPLEMGDADCDGTVDVADVVYLINYLYKGGYPPPC